MLYDRPYMRETPYRPAKPVYVWLIGINVVVWVIQLMLSDSRGHDAPFIREYLTLSPEGIKSGFIWQLLTFQFLHGGPLHLILNCVVLYMWAGPVESMLGRNQFLKMYLLSGVMGGFLQIALGLGWDRFAGPVVGASAGLSGVIAAFATIMPEQRIRLLFPPVSFAAKHLLFGSLVLSLLGMVAPVSPTAPVRVAHAAHLGGLIGGVLFVRYVMTGRIRFPNLGFPFKRGRSGSKIVDVRPTKESFFKKSKSAEPRETSPGDFISREVDPILDKIAEHGIHSLTDRERKILEAARSRMSKR